MSSQTQKGNVPLVAGQQSYAITFPLAFATAPAYFSPALAMPNDSGEIFEISYDLSTLTTTGVTVWLSGVPSAASAGGQINWLALGTSATIPLSATASTGITVVQLCHRIARRARGGDFTKLSMTEQTDLLEAANTGLMRLYNALPTYFKEQTQGFALPGPTAVTGAGVTQYDRTVTGITFSDDQFGQSIALDGDPAWNQIIGTDTLLNPYMGATATVDGTIYGDALFSETYPLDRVIGNPQFANQSIFPLARFTMERSNTGIAPWLWRQAVGVPQAWWPQVFGNSQGNRPIMVLRFAPAPDQAYAVNVRIGFWPKRLTLADYDANAALTVPDQFVEPCLIPMCLQEFMASPAWLSRNDEAQVEARGERAEAYARSQPAQIGAPNNRIFTQQGF